MRWSVAFLVTLLLVASACSDDAGDGTTSAASTATTTLPATTSTNRTTTTTTLAATTSIATTTSTTTVEVADGPVTVETSLRRRGLAQGEVRIETPRLVVPFAPELADEMNAIIDAHIDSIVAAFAKEDAETNGPNDFTIDFDATLVDDQYVSLRFDGFYGIVDIKVPPTAISTLILDVPSARLVTAAEVLMGDEAVAALIPMVEAKMVDLVGESLGVDIHLDDLALTPVGIEVTLDELDGVPSEVQNVTVSFTWAEIADLVDRSRMFSLIGNALDGA